MLLYVCICVGLYKWRSENNFGVLVLSYHMGSECGTLVIRLGGKCLYLLSSLPGLNSQF